MPFLLKLAVLSVSFVILYVFRDKIRTKMKKLPFHEFVLYVLASLPLIILEEQINCQAQWCGTVLIPPTLPFVLTEVVVLYFLVRWLRPKHIWIPLLGYSVFGVFWELTLGGARGALLSGPFLIFMVVWIAISYMFVSLTPLTLMTRCEKSTK